MIYFNDKYIPLRKFREGLTNKSDHEYSKKIITKFIEAAQGHAGPLNEPLLTLLNAL